MRGLGPSLVYVDGTPRLRVAESNLISLPALMLVDIRRTSPLRNGRADWINDESRLATVLRYACLIVRIFATPLYFDEGVNGGYPPIGKALPQNAANHTLDVGLQAMRATIDHAESIGPVTFDSDAIFLHGLLFFDRPSDQRHDLGSDRRPRQGERRRPVRG